MIISKTLQMDPIRTRNENKFVHSFASPALKNDQITTDKNDAFPVQFSRSSTPYNATNQSRGVIRTPMRGEF